MHYAEKPGSWCRGTGCDPKLSLSVGKLEKKGWGIMPARLEVGCMAIGLPGRIGHWVGFKQEGDFDGQWR